MSNLYLVRKILSFQGVALASLMCGALLFPAFTSAAVAVPMKSTTNGSATLIAKPVNNLSSTNARIVVKGKGFDQRIGIYVALCVTPKKGSKKAPGPCGGGINMSASNPASVWISSNPPPYGADLAIPFKKGGVFSLTLSVSSQIGEIDCKVTACSIVTRADHTRSSYRGADVFIPVTFK